MVEVGAKQAVTDSGMRVARVVWRPIVRALRPNLLLHIILTCVPATAWRKSGDQLGHDGEFGVLSVPAADFDAHEVKGAAGRLVRFPRQAPSDLMGEPMTWAKSNIRRA
jgi:hypothetical protein